MLWALVVSLEAVASDLFIIYYLGARGTHMQKVQCNAYSCIQEPEVCTDA